MTYANTMCGERRIICPNLNVPEGGVKLNPDVPEGGEAKPVESDWM